MCLAIPAEIKNIDETGTSATADVLGVQRQINVMLLADEPLRAGDWVLVHVGFAMSRISQGHAAEQLRLLTGMGLANEALREAAGYGRTDGAGDPEPAA